MAAAKTKVPRKAALSLPWIAFCDTRLKILFTRMSMRTRTGTRARTSKKTRTSPEFSEMIWKGGRDFYLRFSYILRLYLTKKSKY